MPEIQHYKSLACRCLESSKYILYKRDALELNLAEMYQDLSYSISETVGNKGTHISQYKEKENPIVCSYRGHQSEILYHKPHKVKLKFMLKGILRVGKEQAWSKSLCRRHPTRNA